jgi:multidrug resistance protein MdtO
VLATFFLMFWALSALASYRLAVRFGYIIVITIPLWDQKIPEEDKVTGTLWAIGSLYLAYLITAAVELVLARFYALDNITDALVERLECTAALLRAWSRGVSDPQLEHKLGRLTILGTSRMRRDMIQSDYPRELTQQMGAVISLVGRLVDTAANLTNFRAQIPKADQQLFLQLADKIETLADHLLRKGVSAQLEFSPAQDRYAAVPLLLQMERTISLIAEVLAGSEFLDRYQPPPQAPPPQTPPQRKPWLVPDAFTNRKHVRFGTRGALAAGACYMAYNLVAWPGINTAVTTCFLTALSTVGSSRQKQVLRFAGAMVGGVILGFGAQVLILPHLDSIAGFLLLFLAVTIPSAWIAASGPRLSYFGVQIALAFYLINLQEFRFQTSLAVARDRFVGIVVGLLAMWLIFDQLWATSALLDMQRTFVSSVTLLSQLMRNPVSADHRSAIEKTYSLRESINTNFDNLRQDADAVMLEFGPSRAQNLALRAQLVRWQIQLRIIFITRIAILKYRFRLPGFELPEATLEAEQEREDRLADRLQAIADRLQGKDAAGPQPDHLPPAAPPEPILAPEAADAKATHLRDFQHLGQRIETLVESLEHEVFAAAPIA